MAEAGPVTSTNTTKGFSMATCNTCSSYYKLSAFNQSLQCENCQEVLDTDEQDSYDRAYQADMIELTNPSGRTKAVYIE